MKKNKARSVTIRFTENDFINIECAAKEEGMSISEYIREQSVPKYILI